MSHPGSPDHPAREFELKKRRPWLWGVLGALALLLIGGLVIGLGRQDKAAAGGDHFGNDLTVAYLSTDAAQQAFVTYVATEIAPDYGIAIEPRGVGDPNQLQAAVSDGDIAGTVYAHQPWIEQSDAGNGTEVTATEPVFQWAYSVWSSSYSSFDDLPDGASIALLDDPANTAQALLLLADNDVITLRDGVDPATATLNDIDANPRRLKFTQIAFGTAARSLDDFDAIVSYNFEFTAAGIPAEDKIFAPPAPRVFAAQLAVGTRYQSERAIKSLVEAFADPRVQDYLATTTDPAVQGQLAPVSAP